jgi:outer membrane receptor protein involved in Fe transport
VNSRFAAGAIGAALACALVRASFAQPESPASTGSAGSDGSGSAGSDGSGSGSAGSGSAGSAAPAAGSGSSAPVLLVPDAATLASQELIEIDDTAPAESASSVHLTAQDLVFRSRTQVSDILRQVPGLMVSQHAGGGKSDQYFIRGFDADHGTDIAIYADGIPVNMPSHGHGQGYADTHFLIPETIGVVDVHKGPYDARFGDFYTAGAMELTTIDKIDAPTMWIAGGVPLAGPKAVDQYNRRIVGMASPEVRDNVDDKALIAVQIADTDGPFDHPQDFRQGNALVKWQGRVGPGDLKLETNWYSARWNASGQLPVSAVSSGLVDQFGSLDPSEGGDTGRTTAQLGYTVHDDHGGTWRASAFLLQYNFRLFSNFTLYARDPVHGDEIEQDDVRTTWGLDAAYSRRLDLADMDSIITVGAQLRNDDVDNGLWHAQDRVRLPDCFDKPANPCNHTEDRIRDLGAYAEATIHVLPHVHVLPGLRLQQVSWDVTDLDPATMIDPSTTTGGTAGKAIVLPKLSVEVEASPKLNLFANAGSGYHSNDARGIVAADGTGALARALGAETGVRTTAIPHGRVAVDLWYLHLDSELVWNGDEGGTDAAGPTRRYGVDVEAAYNPLPWLRFDGNISVAHSAYVANHGNGNALALAPKLMGQGGVTLVGGDHFIALRARGIADRPGNDTGTLVAEGYLIFDLIAGQRLGKHIDLNLTVNNLLDSAWREAQFADSSRVTPTSPIVEQMHFTPGIPLTATVTAAISY